VHNSLHHSEHRKHSSSLLWTVWFRDLHTPEKISRPRNTIFLVEPTSEKLSILRLTDLHNLTFLCDVFWIFAILRAPSSRPSACRRYFCRSVYTSFIDVAGTEKSFSSRRLNHLVLATEVGSGKLTVVWGYLLINPTKHSSPVAPFWKGCRILFSCTTLLNLAAVRPLNKLSMSFRYLTSFCSYFLLRKELNDPNTFQMTAFSHVSKVFHAEDFTSSLKTP
jgi:hypothetical protein